MARDYISEPEASQLVAEYNAGNGSTIVQLSAKYGRQNCTIIRFLKRQGVFVKKESWDKASSKLTPELVQQIAEDYKTGVSQDNLGLKYKVSATLVRKALLRAGVDSRPSFRTANSERVVDDTALCSCCNTRKSVCDFYNTKITGEAAPMYVCKECYRWQNRLRKYGVTKEQYQQLFNEQKGCCPGCGVSWGGTVRHPDLVVDHDHVTGKVRGLLCPECNKALGHTRDSAATLRRLADYADLHTAKLAEAPAPALPISNTSIPL